MRMKHSDVLSRFCFGLVLSLFIYKESSMALPATSYVYPLVGTRISSDFGKRIHPVAKSAKHHSGIDLAAPYGSQVRAVLDGTVIFADPYGGYGNLVVVQHANGMTTHYGHCRTLIAKPGQKIRAGQIIATVGSTGISTGPHLHFEIRVNGVAKDPQNFLPGLADEAVG